MPDDDPGLTEGIRQAAEKLGVTPLKLVEGFLSLSEKQRAEFLAKLQPPKKRGRRKGSGGDYSAALRRMAHRIISTPGLSDTEAAEPAAAEWNASNSPLSVSPSYLRHLYGKQREHLEAEARKPRPTTPSRKFTAAEIGLAGGKATAYAAIEEAQAQQRRHIQAIIGEASAAQAESLRDLMEKIKTSAVSPGTLALLGVAPPRKPSGPTGGKK